MNAHYDIIIIGSGPAGQKAAFSMAKRGKSVLVVENRPRVGGGCLHTGTIPSKTLREAAIYYSRYYSPLKIYGKKTLDAKTYSIHDIISRLDRVLSNEVEMLNEAFLRNNIDITYGSASFIDTHTIKVEDDNGDVSKYQTKHVLIATGSSPNRPKNIPFDDQVIMDSDSILRCDQIPKSLIICGAGVIGSEYACIFSALGAKVHLINRHSEVLNFVDSDIRQFLTKEMKKNGITMHSNVEIEEVKKTESGKAFVRLNNGVELEASRLLYSMGRNGNTDKLALKNVGIKIEKYGLIKVDENFKTSTENIYACGDVIGYPSLASVSSEQGRIAVHHILKIPHNPVPELFPYGIYTIPEISYVGKTEDQLKEANIPYVSGLAGFDEVSRGQIRGTTQGRLKLLVHSENLKILGVHAVGYNATELIHIGQAVLTYSGDLNYFLDTVFNYPTFAEAYKVAALNAMNKLPESCRMHNEKRKNGKKA